MRRRLLLLLPFPPDPNGTHGAARMTGQLAEALADEHEVGVVYLRAAEEPPIDAALAATLALVAEVERPSLEDRALPAQMRRTARRAVGLAGGRPLWASDWHVPAFAARVREVVHDWRPEVLQAELSVMGQYLAQASAPLTVLVDHDPGSRAAADLAAWERGLRRLGRRLDALAWRRYERRLLPAVDAVVAFTEDDRRALTAVAHSAQVVQIAPGIRPAAQPDDPAGGGARVLFLGSFRHPPNVDAALRLARDIMPAVRARVPEATLEIVGEAPPPAVSALAGDGVVVTGRVADVAPYLDGAAVVTAPLRLGGGMRVKVLEALAAGKATVATPRALAGLDLVPGEHALVAEEDAELSAALAELLEDPERRRRLAAAARDWARQNLAWERAAGAYGELYERLLAAGAGK